LENSGIKGGNGGFEKKKEACLKRKTPTGRKKAGNIPKITMLKKKNLENGWEKRGENKVLNCFTAETKR